MSRSWYNKALVLVIIVLFISVAAAPNIATDITEKEVIKRDTSDERLETRDQNLV